MDYYDAGIALQAKGYAVCVARKQPHVQEEDILDFSSGYIQRSLKYLPKQGDQAPWKLHQNYGLDSCTLRWGSLEDGVLVFTQAKSQSKL